MKTMERGVNLCNEQCNEQCLRMALFLFYNQRSTAFRLGCFQLNGLMLLFGVLMILQYHDTQEVIEVVFTLNLYSAKRSTMRNYFCELFSSVKNELMKTNKLLFESFVLSLDCSYLENNETVKCQPQNFSSKEFKSA